MVDIAPFRALRYAPQGKSRSDISRFICPPYDVISPAEREALVKKSPSNVVQLELPVSQNGDKYAAAAALLRTWKAQALLQEDRASAFYLIETKYRIKDPFAPAKALKRYGIMSALRLETPGRGAVHPHERTLPKAKEDRMNLISALQTNISPIFGLFFDKGKKWSALIEKAVKQKTIARGAEKKDLEHRVWKIDDPGLQKKIRELLSDKDLYIADGHHRYEVSWANKEARLKAEPSASARQGWNRVMAYICPMEERGLLMLPTHRLLRTEKTIDQWRAHLESIFDIKPVRGVAAVLDRLRRPRKERAIGWVHQGGAALLTLKRGISVDRCLDARPPALRQLDVVLLHDLALGEASEPPFIKEREMVYSRDIKEIQDRMRKDPFWVAFLLSSPGVESLARVANANEVMPPKTTYFYPKVPTGFTLMPLEQEIG